MNPIQLNILVIGKKLLCSHVLLKKFLDLASCDLFFCISHRIVLKFVCKVLGTEQDDAPVKRRLVHFDSQTQSSIPLVHNRKETKCNPIHTAGFTEPSPTDDWRFLQDRVPSPWASLSCLSQFHREKLTQSQQAHQVLTCLHLQVDKQVPAQKGPGNLCHCINVTPHLSQKATQSNA